MSNQSYTYIFPKEFYTLQFNAIMQNLMQFGDKKLQHFGAKLLHIHERRQNHKYFNETNTS